MFDPFSWLRRKAAEAVMGGVGDALRAITPEGETPPTDLGDLRAMLAASVEPKALPAAEDAEQEAPAKRRR